MKNMIRLCIFIFMCVVLNVTSIPGPWFIQSDNSRLPQRTVAHAITGYIIPNDGTNHAGIMFILGGCDGSVSDLTCYNSTQSYNHHMGNWEYPNVTGFSPSIYGIGQTFTTINQFIYFNFNGYVGQFDMKNIEYSYPYNDLVLPNKIVESCLTDNGINLYFIGGINQTSGNGTTQTQVYSIASQTWGNGTPLNIARFYASCNVINNKIYIIAGTNENTNGINSIEKSNIINNLASWSIFTDTIDIKRSKHRSIVYGNIIWVFGGETWYNGDADNTVLQLDTMTDTLSYSDHMLKTRIGASVYYDGWRVFIFGGFGENNVVELHWEFSLHIFTPPPTVLVSTKQAPTPKVTTQVPTQEPTPEAPAPALTQEPTTEAPAQAPTPEATPEAPAQAPTQAPPIPEATTQAPTVEPTREPTSEPTKQPTLESPKSNSSPGTTDQSSIRHLLISVISVMGFIVVLFIICCWCLCRKHNTMRKEMKLQSDSNVRSVNVGSVNVGSVTLPSKSSIPSAYMAQTDIMTRQTSQFSVVGDAYGKELNSTDFVIGENNETHIVGSVKSYLDTQIEGRMKVPTDNIGKEPSKSTESMYKTVPVTQGMGDDITRKYTKIPQNNDALLNNDDSDASPNEFTTKT